MRAASHDPVSDLLQAAALEGGDAAGKLFPLVYDFD
jgi:hypothetical protein